MLREDSGELLAMHKFDTYLPGADLRELDGFMRDLSRPLARALIIHNEVAIESDQQNCCRSWTHSMKAVLLHLLCETKQASPFRYELAAF